MRQTSLQFNTQRLKERETLECFGIVLQNRSAALQDLVEEKTMEEHWNQVRDIWEYTCTETQSRRSRHQKEWKPSDTGKVINTCKQLINNSSSEVVKELKSHYQTANKEARRSDRGERLSK